MDDILEFNGIDARSGSYLLELTAKQVANVASGGKLDAAELGELKDRKDRAEQGHYGVEEGVDVCDLAQTGWGVVFAACAPDGEEGKRQAAICEALAPLLALRRAQASRIKEHRYKVYSGTTGVLPSDNKLTWLARNGTGPGPAKPDIVPYYLLIVGDPEAVSYRFQSQLAVQRAVGRIHFDTIEEYASYAQSVVAAETGQIVLPRRATFFGVSNPDDLATQSSARNLVGELANTLGADPQFSEWELRRLIGEQATRSALHGLLHGGDSSALLFTASHGLGFPKDDPLQLRHQGALLCQDWPGPKAWRGKPIPEDFYLAGDHLSSDANLLGSVAFLFACYGAGTPALDEFYKQAFQAPTPIASRSFVAGLPKAMLSRPKGGALAVIGHVERAWGHSFMWAGTGPGGRSGVQLGAFESTTRALMKGTPVGAAMEFFGGRYAELSTEISSLLNLIDARLTVDPYVLASLWTANNDARNYAILGDPAVRLSVGPADGVMLRTSLPSVPATVAPAAVAPAAVAPAVVAPAVVAPAVVAPAEPTATATVEPGTSFGLLDRLTGRDAAEPVDVKPAEPTSIQRFLARIGDSLSRALDDATSLDVSTWVAKDMANARWEGGKMVGAELRAFTRVSLDGDTVVCLPERDGELDREVWDIHAAAVQQAQQTRAELLKTLVEAAASLASLTK